MMMKSIAQKRIQLSVEMKVTKKKEKGNKTKKKDLGRKKTVKVTAVMRKRKTKMTANSMKICFVPLKKM